MLTQERLKQVMHYDPLTGFATWLVAQGRSRIGERVGHLRPDGYVCTKIDKKAYKLHRLAWLYIYGAPVPKRLDHRDNVGDHNWIENIRECTHSQNMCNRKVNRNNSSGAKGISRRGKSFRVYIDKDGQRLWIGNFANLEEAMAARAAEALRLHGDFARAA